MKRKLKILGIIFITLLIPFVINFVDFIIIFSLKYKFGATDDLLPFLINSIGLIALLAFLWLIFIKAKEKYLADAYIAGICFVFVGAFFFSVATWAYPYLSSY